MTSHECLISKMPINEVNNPEWLTLLLGESPLLSDRESKFIADLRSQIIEDIKSQPKVFIDKGVCIKQKLSAMKDNFEQVVKHLKGNKAYRLHFMNMYPEWRKLRDHNIIYLRSIAKAVQEARQKCQIANLIGNCVSLIGGGICLASGLRSNRLARIDGSAMIGLGTLTSAGSCMVEVGILHSNIKEAEKILKEDEECSKHLWKWLSDSSHFQAAMDNIRYIDVEMNLKLIANVIQDAFKKKRNKTETERIIKRMLSSLNIPPIIAEEISDVIGILIATSMLYDRYRPLFDLAYTGTKTILQLSTVIDLFRTAVVVNSALSTNERARSAQIQKTRLASGMVLDLISIFLCCKDLKSQSKQAEKIIEASDILEKETEEFERLYMITSVIEVDERI